MNKTHFQLSLILLFVVVSALSLHAQSGRRKVTPPPAAPIPTPTPEPTPIPPKELDKKPNTGFIVGMDRGGAFGAYSTTYYDVAQSSCAERLRSTSSAWVDIARDEMTRADAIKRAKGETTGYVVYLQMGNSMGSVSTQNNNDLEIEYTVFAPGTAKTVTGGRGYPNANRKGPLVVQPPIGTNNAMVREQLLRLAAEDVADRILKALHVPTN